MASTEIEIVNKAAFLMGEEEITSFTEESVFAKVANIMYPLIRDEVSRMHEWNCLLEQKQLIKLVATSKFGWTALYNLPDDCLRVLSFDPDYGLSQKSKGRDSFPFRIHGRQVLTNEEEGLDLTYIKRLTDVTKMDANLVDVIATKLAFDASYKITGSTTNSQLLEVRYKKSLNVARALNSKEQGNWFRDSSTVTNRYGVGPTYFN